MSASDTIIFQNHNLRILGDGIIERNAIQDWKWTPRGKLLEEIRTGSQEQTSKFEGLFGAIITLVQFESRKYNTRVLIRKIEWRGEEFFDCPSGGQS